VLRVVQAGLFSFTVGGKDLQVKLIDADAANVTYRVSTDGGATFKDIADPPADADATAVGTGLAGAADAIAKAINRYTDTDYRGLTATAGSDGSVTVNQSINFTAANFDPDGATPDADKASVSADGTALTIEHVTIADEQEFNFTINGKIFNIAVDEDDQYGVTQAGVIDQIEAALAAAAGELGGLTFEVAGEDDAGTVSATHITITATANTTTLLEDAEGTPASSTSALSVASAADARASIDAIDAAINTVNTQRANLGAVSNRLDSTVNNLTNISTNLEAGRSRIQDADFAAESTNLAKSQILQQASMAMLAQANASKQGVLSLLQG
jgi:flagellin